MQAPKKRTSACLMFSGGLDSSTLWHDLAGRGELARAIYLNMGQCSHDSQIHVVRNHSILLDLPLDVVDASKALEGLTAPPHVRVAEPGGPLDCGDSCSSLTLAALHASSAGYQVMYAGYTKEDVAAFPKLPQMIDLAAAMVGLNTRNEDFRIVAPFADKPKSEIIQIAVQRGVDLAQTWTCLWSGELHCGTCPRCLSRREAFAAARVDDPTPYRS